MKLLHARPPFNFCGDERSDFNECKVVVLPVPYDSTTSYNPGARNGPHAIIQASRNLEWYDVELRGSPGDIGIFTLDELEPSMKSPEETIARVEEAITEILEKGKFPVVIGGEHSVSLGAIRSVNAAYENISVLQLDAHADLRDKYEGTKYNHACVMRRARELCNVVQVGIRSMSEEEALYVEDEGIRLFMADEILERREGLLEEVLEMLSDNVYITVDVDVFDPSYLPATGTPEPGGLGWYDVLSILRPVFGRRRVVGFDVVELSPIPGDVSSDFLVAKLIYKMVGYRFKGSY